MRKRPRRLAPGPDPGCPVVIPRISCFGRIRFNKNTRDDKGGDAMEAKGSDGQGASDQYDNVACPFCGILCDDLSVQRTASGLKVTKNGCEKAIARLRAAG